MKKDFIDRYNELLQELRQIELDYANGKISEVEYEAFYEMLQDQMDDLKRS